MAKFPGRYTKEQKREADALGLTLKYYADLDQTIACEKIGRVKKPRTFAQKKHQNIMAEAIKEAQRLKSEGLLPHYEDRTCKSDFHEYVSRYFKSHS